jgi:hypothetical protein
VLLLFQAELINLLHDNVSTCINTGFSQGIHTKAFPRAQMDALTSFHSPHCPHDSCILSVLRGFRNGVVYGCKIRFPHALVMTLLFKEGRLATVLACCRV